MRCVALTALACQRKQHARRNTKFRTFKRKQDFSEAPVLVLWMCRTFILFYTAYVFRLSWQAYTHTHTHTYIYVCVCVYIYIYIYIQCVPLATEPRISLIILTPMKILQRNLNRGAFVVWEIKRNVSVVCLIVATRSSGPPASRVRQQVGHPVFICIYIMNPLPCLNPVSMQLRTPHSVTMQMQEAYTSETSARTYYHTLRTEQQYCYLFAVTANHKLKCALTYTGLYVRV
jgi:hypothetical protein